MLKLSVANQALWCAALIFEYYLVLLMSTVDHICANIAALVMKVM